MKLLMPLRVPELAPSLGRIIVPRRQQSPWVPLDDIREELATRVLELGGEGRATEARATVLETTGRRAWAAAWDHAVRRAANRVAEALDELDIAASRVSDASVLEKDAHAAWQDALRTVARRLEAAWLALETEVEEERHRWASELEALAKWRPRLWPVFVIWIPLAGVLIWLGLILGGYVPAPAWLAARLGF